MEFGKAGTDTSASLKACLDIQALRVGKLIRSDYESERVEKNNCLLLFIILLLRGLFMTRKVSGYVSGK